MKLTIIPDFVYKALLFGGNFQIWNDSYEYKFIASNTNIYYYRITKQYKEVGNIISL